MRKWGFPAALLLCLLVSCQTESAVTEASFTAMDTVVTGRFYGAEAEEASAAIEQELEELEGIWSKTIPESDVARLNAEQELPKDDMDDRTVALLERALTLSGESGGCFDPVLGRLVSLWGIGTEDEQIPGQEELQQALAQSGAGKLQETEEDFRLQDGAQVDLGGIAKGAATDALRQVLDGMELDGYQFSLGGNVYVGGKKPDGTPWRIGINDPEGESAYIGYLEAADCAVVTSGDYERYFILDGVRYHHILDPADGNPARSGLRSVTVVSADGTLADAMSTALFVMGAERGLEYCAQHGLEALFITEENEVLLTGGLRESFTLTETERFQLSEGME